MFCARHQYQIGWRGGEVIGPVTCCRIKLPCGCSGLVEVSIWAVVEALVNTVAMVVLGEVVEKRGKADVSLALSVFIFNHRKGNRRILRENIAFKKTFFFFFSMFLFLFSFD